jgi:hypothetical protein
MKKTKIKLDDMERRILVKLLYEKRNELIRVGRYTDAIDELIIKIIDTSRYVYEFGISTKYSLEKCREQLIIAHGINHLVSTQQNNHRSCRSMQNPKPLPLTNMYI